MGALLTSVWGKVVTGAAGAMLALAALFFGLWVVAARGEAEALRERDAALDAQIEAEQETKRTTDALRAAESRAQARNLQADTQRRDEERLQDEPSTNICGDSRAIRRALDILRERSADNPPRGDSAGNPKNVR